MLDRINRTAITTAAFLLLVGSAAAAGTSYWPDDLVVTMSGAARPWLLALVALCAVPILSWPARGVAHLIGRRRLGWGVLAAGAWVVLASNLLFWGLVQAEFPPVSRLYETGRVVWIGDRAFLFGHGYWKQSDGYWRHETVVRMGDGSIYRGPTIDLLGRLRERGAATVWGSWCYTGNYPYIQKDLVTGIQLPWPAYASYNRAPGVTIPIWLGSVFVRLAWPKDRYVAEPETVGPVPIDTVYLMRPSMSRVEQSFELMQHHLPGMPKADSVSWRPIDPDTVHAMSRTALRELEPDVRRLVRRRERQELKSRAKTGLALFWVHGRAFPMYIHVPARLHRTLEAPDELSFAVPAALIHEGAGG